MQSYVCRLTLKEFRTLTYEGLNTGGNKCKDKLIKMCMQTTNDYTFGFGNNTVHSVMSSSFFN